MTPVMNDRGERQLWLTFGKVTIDDEHMSTRAEHEMINRRSRQQ